MSQPLSGIRVLDLSRLLPGAYASQMLADFGADVIKVEEPGSGDYGRYMPPHGPGGMSLYFTAINRNKRSITLNLKAEQGREVFLSMLRNADVVLELRHEPRVKGICPLIMAKVAKQPPETQRTRHGGRVGNSVDWSLASTVRK